MSGLLRRSGMRSGGRPVHWAEPLPEHGVENLHRIAPALYRSAQPRGRDAPALRRLGVRTLLSFRAFNGDDDEFRGDGFALLRVPINTWHIGDRHIVRALGALLDAQQDGPVLIHCMHGADRTGLVSAMYRMAMQGWSRDEARQEMLLGGFGYHTMWRNIPSYLAAVDPAAIVRLLGPRG
jgi:protein tyrosine phosphatase (PTP) superfamily phosphohydrolase (DUF442 family)